MDSQLLPLRNNNITYLSEINNFIEWSSKEYNSTPLILEIENIAHTKTQTKKRKKNKKKQGKNSSTRRSNGNNIAASTATANNANSITASTARGSNNRNNSTVSTATANNRNNSTVSIARGSNDAIIYNFDIKGYSNLRKQNIGNWTRTKFIKTFEFILTYSLYVLNKQAQPKTKFSGLKEYINGNNDFLKQLGDNANAYRISKENKTILYKTYLKPSLDTYTPEYIDNFMKLNGSVYVNNFHGAPVTNDGHTFKVPENTKILFVAPMNSYGYSSGLTQEVLEMLSNSKLLEGITKYGCEYYESLDNKTIPYQFKNFTLYTDGQQVPLMTQSFKFTIYYYIANASDNSSPNIDESMYKYSSPQNFEQYAWCKLIDILYDKNPDTNDDNIYYKLDTIYSYIGVMVIAKINQYRQINIDKMNNIVKRLYNDKKSETNNKLKDNMPTDDEINELNECASLLIEVLIHDEVISECNINNNKEYVVMHCCFKIKLDNYINIMNTMTNNSKRGNVYIFSLCRVYNNEKNIASVQHYATTFIYNYINKYISHKKIKENLDGIKKLFAELQRYSISEYIASSLCKLRDIKSGKDMVNNPSLAYELLASDMSKHILTLIAVSYALLIGYEKHYYIQWSLYCLFIKNLSINKEDTKPLHKLLQTMHKPVNNNSNSNDAINKNRMNIYRYLYKYYKQYCEWLLKYNLLMEFCISDIAKRADILSQTYNYNNNIAIKSLHDYPDIKKILIKIIREP